MKRLIRFDPRSEVESLVAMPATHSETRVVMLPQLGRADSMLWPALGCIVNRQIGYSKFRPSVAR